ncbi:uncharacterized protein Aud_004571 [Aspergillus udagawae]|uniref:Uncharacterized protein n=1 Tax=Aspergillus udagawae TaxID=91492 RepID=A0A8E0QNI1_9EURO|nr:uncharacterized protein Aud_004571 [Aspergillus udagawae]GIC88179.1 hypothetical protein Aud_004571 [Aspergillus udagawae]
MSIIKEKSGTHHREEEPIHTKRMMDANKAVSVCTSTQTNISPSLCHQYAKETNLSLAGERLLVASGTFTTAHLVVEADLAAVVAFVIEVVDRGGRVVDNGAFDAFDAWDSRGAGDSEEEGEAEEVEELHFEVVDCDGIEWT